MTHSSPTADFIKTGVLGYPIHHSRSPIIHTHWISTLGLSGSYEALAVKPENLALHLPRLLKEGGYRGFNLTIPHKELALELCDVLDPVAVSIGAVNTVALQKDGRIFGTNTDAFGFIYNIKHHAPNFRFKNSHCVVLGAGGAARAVIYGLLEEGAERIYVTNRTLAKAKTLTALNSDRVIAVPWEDRHCVLGAAHLLVNTTALGMTGKPALDIDITSLPADAVVTDIVYTPLMTPLLQTAHTAGHKIITGIGMLLHQARPAFELWYGLRPPVTDTLERLIL